MERVRFDAGLRGRADATLRAAAHAETLIADGLRTPQSPRYHAEGPTVEDHVRLMLMTLQAVIDDQLHLVDIEEFRRMKGYGGELEELEEMLKENAALYEVFALVHDAAKWACLSFEAHPDSRGAALGFVTEPFTHWDDVGISERAKLRERYLELYQRFSELHPSESDQDTQSAFFVTYGIEVHYPGHDRAVRTPVYERLVRRLATAHRLTDRDTELLLDLIGHHLDPLHDFSEPNPKRIARYHALAEARGWDTDDFIDLLQGCLFLDAVCGSERAGAHGRWHDMTPLGNFLHAEHDFAPWRRAEKDVEREERRKREMQAVFREVGLDGVALMDLLKLEPGPAFGAILRDVQDAIVEGRSLPNVGEAKGELERRAAQFFEKTFAKDL